MHLARLTDRQIPRHESCRHDYGVAPSAAPWKISHTSQSTQASLDSPPASAVLLLAPYEYHVPTCTHINIQRHTHTHTLVILSLGCSWSRYRGWAWLPLSHIRARLYRCDYITRSHDLPPPLHVIRFQEHWAHKPGHVLLCPVCQNNSAVSNTVRLRFHFSLPRYCRTLQRVTFPMSTSLQFVKMRASIPEPLTSDESNSRRWGGPSTRMILWNLWPFVTVCRESLWITASWTPQRTRKQRPKEEMLSGSKGSSVERWCEKHKSASPLFLPTISLWTVKSFIPQPNCDDDISLVHKKTCTHVHDRLWGRWWWCWWWPREGGGGVGGGWQRCVRSWCDFMHDVLRDCSAALSCMCPTVFGHYIQVEPSFIRLQPHDAPSSLWLTQWGFNESFSKIK